MRTLIALLLAVAAFPANADFRYSTTKLQLYLPATTWAVTLPREDWFVAQERVKPDGSGMYFVASSPARGVHLSVIVQGSTECNSGPTCRAKWKENAAAGLAKATGIRESERNGFSVIEFQLDKPEGVDVVQANAWGHAYRDGQWIDVHLSKVGKTRPDPKELLAVLDTIAIAPKALDATRIYVVPGSKSYAFDVPVAWRDAVGGDKLPTVSFKPASGNGFEILMTLIPPRAPDAPPPPREEALGHAKRAVASILETSVEKKIEPREVKGKSAWGYAFDATDREPGEGYKFMRQAFIVTGNQMLFVTVLYRPGSERDAEVATQMALSARSVP